jgi:putative transposase
MIDRMHPLSITRQAAALGISHGAVYYAPRPMAALDLALMRQIDVLHLAFPFAGSRMLRGCFGTSSQASVADGSAR